MKSPKLLSFISLAAVLLLAFSSPLWSEEKANQLFGAKLEGTKGVSEPIGSYAKGCLAGGVVLPETGPTWQAMRLSRNRNWGHPILIDFIIDLSEKAKEIGWNGLYVGDLTQPRGGPMTSGHSSHQIGLDVDIWMLPPGRLNLTRQEREEISSISIRSADQKNVTDNWTDSHMELLKAAAKDSRVDRIFVAAAAKIDMCNKAGEDRMWLQKIRPYYGHSYHFHVRLVCPDSSTNCITQTPTVNELSKGGDGCDENLYYWVSDYFLDLMKKPRDPDAPVPRTVRDYVMADLPEECKAVLDAS